MKMPFLLLAAPLVLLLTACGAAQPVFVPQVVKIPVPVYCQVKDVKKPSMPFDETAAPDMSLYQKVQLLAAQDQALKGYSTELAGALAGCRAPSGAEATTATTTK